MYNLHKLFPKVAIVADQMTSFGGADREMMSMLKVFPQADIFTVLFYKEKYPMITNRVYTSFVQKYTKVFGKKFSRHLKVLNPVAYESFSFEGYDLVISISAGPAKSVITGIDQPHLAMVMTPPRSLWDNELNARASKFRQIYRWLSNILNTYLRVWDVSISKRVDYWSSNSEFVAKKIKKTYGVTPKVLYPGIEERYFEPVASEDIEEVRKKYSVPEDFVLVVSRLYDYKRVDWAIRAVQKSGDNLVIVGEGPDIKFLKKIAKGDPKIQFLGFITDDEVKALYAAAKVLLFCGIEDFGLVPIEAMATGTLVFAYKYGGVLETVSEGKSGEFFENEEKLVELLKKLDKRMYNKRDIVNQARKFSEERFLNNFTEYLKQIHEKESSKLA
ncbi:MAG TPA: glycosyltransferase [Candidatus Dojkabacteria bacterium]|nr:glycosyltransferase [Candidatus Dojkabacteria bacterium]